MDWKRFCALLEKLADPATPWPGQVGLGARVVQAAARATLRCRVQPHRRSRTARAAVDAAPEHASDFSPSSRSIRRRVTSDQSGAASKDEDYVILSTIHSAKGQEWDFVYVLNVADGNFPVGVLHRQTGDDRGGAALAVRGDDPRAQRAASVRAAQVRGDSTGQGRRCARLRRQEPIHDRQGAGLFRAHHLSQPARRRKLASPSRGPGARRPWTSSRSSRRCGERAHIPRRPRDSSLGVPSRSDAPINRSADQRRLDPIDYQRRGPPPPPPPPPPAGLDRGARSWASFTRSGRPPIWKPFVC